MEYVKIIAAGVVFFSLISGIKYGWLKGMFQRRNWNKNFFSHYTACVDVRATIGKGTNIWHYSHVMEGAKIGEKCILGQNVFVAGDACIGNNVKIQNNVSVYAGVVCEDNVFLGPSMVFTNVKTPRSEINRRGNYTKTHLGRGVTVGANATIICGTTIGAYAFIGAGSVVTKDVPRHSLVMGNPARVVGWVSKAGERLEFNEAGVAVCPSTGKRYTNLNGLITET